MEALNVYPKEICAHYDRIVMAGYYDYKTIAAQLDQLFSGKKNLLEIGIGTGLVAEKLLALGYQIEGVDFSEGMIQLCEQRLGQNVKLHLADIKDFRAPEKFDGVYSVGGPWYLIRSWNGDLNVVSHLQTDKENAAALCNVINMLAGDGVLALNVQPRHQRLDNMQLSEGELYTQRVDHEEDEIKKYYIVKDGKKVLANHSCVFKVYTLSTFNILLIENGFNEIEINTFDSFGFAKKSADNHADDYEKNTGFYSTSPLSK